MEWISSWKATQIDFSRLLFMAEHHRQVIRLKNNRNGTALRIHFNNLFATKPLVFHTVMLCVDDADGTRKIPVCVHGDTKITLPPASVIFSDPLMLEIHAGEDILIETQVEENIAIAGFSLTFSPLLAHIETNGSLQSSAPEVFASLAEQMPGVAMVYGVDCVEVLGEPVEIIDFFGDSITQMGFWSEALSLKIYDKYPGVFITRNHGMAGNRLLHDSPSAVGTTYGVAGVKRFEKDVFGSENPSIVILQIGINDLCHPTLFNLTDEVVNASQLIQGLSELAQIAHSHGAKVICCTLLPFMEYEIWNEHLEDIRQKVNDWIRNNKVFDHTFDFANLLCDKLDERKLDTTSHIGDGLHPSPSGGKRIAAGINLAESACFNR